jgi:hypothetical protein
VKVYIASPIVNWLIDVETIHGVNVEHVTSGTPYYAVQLLVDNLGWVDVERYEGTGAEDLANTLKAKLAFGEVVLSTEQFTSLPSPD